MPLLDAPCPDRSPTNFRSTCKTELPNPGPVPTSTRCDRTLSSVTRYAIDAETLVDVVRDGRSVGPGHQLVAPNAIRSQALEILLRAVQRGELTELEALNLHERMTALKMRLLGDRVSRGTAWKIAREHHGSIRDAEYVAIAMLQADSLVPRMSNSRISQPERFLWRRWRRCSRKRRRAVRSCFERIGEAQTAR